MLIRGSILVNDQGDAEQMACGSISAPAIGMTLRRMTTGTLDVINTFRKSNATSLIRPKDSHIPFHPHQTINFTIMKKLIFLMLLSTATLLSSFDNPRKDNPFSNYSNSIVLQWNSIAFETMKGPTYDPMIASRIFAMVHIAVHDALNSIEPLYETYALQQQDKKADPIAAISSAAYTVLVVSFPAKKEQLDIALANAVKEVKSSDARKRGLDLGAAAGKAIVIMRSTDGAFQNPVVEVNNPKVPGMYQAVPPTLFVYAPFWATLPTFGLENPHQFRVEAMPSLSSAEYAKHFNEVKSKGAKVNSTRTAEETTIANFWYEFSEIGWNRVASTIAADKQLDLYSTARLLALVNMALADSYIAGWDAKFFYNFWRPYTGIHAAAADGNEQTIEDTAWEPLLNTPPVQDYPSTHSILGSAAATVLNGLVGNNTGFTMTSTSALPEGSTRSFVNFSQAAIENANSRVFAGIHFRFSCERGLEMGKEIGEWIEKNQLQVKSGSNNF